MWLNDSTQTAETTSISPWNMEQQSRWANGGIQLNGLTSCDERLHNLVPPAFRNGSAKVVWQDPKSLVSVRLGLVYFHFRTSSIKDYFLEANVNEALGITNCYGAPNSQFSEQNGLNVSSFAKISQLKVVGVLCFQSAISRFSLFNAREIDLTFSFAFYPFLDFTIFVSVSIQSSYAGGGSAWNQSETVRPNLWEYNTTSSAPLPNGFGGPVLGGNGIQPKGWCGSEEQWDTLSKRNVSFAYGPPPAFNNSGNGAWQQNGVRIPPPGARFTPSTPYDGNLLNNPTMQSSGMPSPISAPPQRSRLQSLWSAGPAANNVMAGICVPPPNREYNMLSSSGPFMPPAPVNPVGYGMPKKQYGPPFTNSVSSQMPMGPVNSSAPSNSFMGEDSVWQDPNQELRKWQRDTGTAIWGDPEKQTREIRRWLPPLEDEDGLSTSSDPKRKKIIPLGWGDLPVSFNSSKSPVSTSSGFSSIGQPTNWARKSSQPVIPSSNSLFDSSLLNKTLSSQTLSKISSVLGQDELASLVAAVQINSAMNGDGALTAGNVPFSNAFSGIGDPLKAELRDGFTSVKLSIPETRGKGRDATVGNILEGLKRSIIFGAFEKLKEFTLLESFFDVRRKFFVVLFWLIFIGNGSVYFYLSGGNVEGLAALSEAATATMPRFGDSLLDVTTGLDQPKSLFSF
ncbi:unnamed protein product [Enterobius vermicularis]|uniref:Uncharacterized protein n=1 Tax=Enterobius vermicularis TaxID=51028 RepID=A0A0N4V8C2_ENTVE|nr:unnamed protein product [Enterobius vermicularis]